MESVVNNIHMSATAKEEHHVATLKRGVTVLLADNIEDPILAKYNVRIFEDVTKVRLLQPEAPRDQITVAALHSQGRVLLRAAEYECALVHLTAAEQVLSGNVALRHQLGMPVVLLTLDVCWCHLRLSRLTKLVGVHAKLFEAQHMLQKTYGFDVDALLSEKDKHEFVLALFGRLYILQGVLYQLEANPSGAREKLVVASKIISVVRDYNKVMVRLATSRKPIQWLVLHKGCTRKVAVEALRTYGRDSALKALDICEEKVVKDAHRCQSTRNTMQRLELLDVPRDEVEKQFGRLGGLWPTLVCILNKMKMTTKGISVLAPDLFDQVLNHNAVEDLVDLLEATAGSGLEFTNLDEESKYLRMYYQPK